MERFKDLCVMDCETKKVFENQKYYDLRMSTMMVCLGCIHHIKKDNFIQKASEEEENDYPWQIKGAKSVSRWKQFRNWARNGFN